MDTQLLNTSAWDTTPVMPPPPGVTSNFENPVTLAPICRTAIFVAAPLAIVSLALRLYTRLRVTRSIGIDDCKILSERIII